MNTVAEIKRLHLQCAESGEAGDLLQAALCQIALGGAVCRETMDALRGSERAMLAERYGVSRDGTTQDIGAQARAERECVRVIHEQD